MILESTPCGACKKPTVMPLTLIGLREMKVCRSCSDLWVQTYQTEGWYREITRAADAVAHAREKGSEEDRKLTKRGMRDLKEAADRGNIAEVDRIKKRQIEEFKKLREWRSEQSEVTTSERIKLEDFVHNNAIDEAFVTLGMLANAPE